MTDEFILPVILVVAGLGSGVLAGVAALALFRRQSLSYPLETLAVGTLLLRSFLGVVTLGGLVSAHEHHLLEHALDAVVLGSSSRPSTPPAASTPNPRPPPTATMTETRATIADAVRAHPGIHFNELVRTLDLANGQVQYHLGRLRDEGSVVAERLYGRTHYYPPGYDEWERRALALLRRETAGDVVAYLLANGPTPPGRPPRTSTSPAASWSGTSTASSPTASSRSARRTAA